MENVKQAYVETNGSIGEMMNHIPHSTHDDEARFVVLVSKLIQEGTLPLLPEWESSTKDEKAKLVRRKQGQKEAKEAEELAKELGVWDEFYGSGKAGARKSKNGGKGKGKATKEDGEAGEEEDVSVLQALMLKKRKNMDSFFDGLAEKYAEPAPRGKKGKKRSKAVADEEDEEVPAKKARKGGADMPDIDDEEFAKLQEKLFGDKAKSNTTSSPKKGRAAGKARKAR